VATELKTVRISWKISNRALSTYQQPSSSKITCLQGSVALAIVRWAGAEEEEGFYKILPANTDGINTNNKLFSHPVLILQDEL